MFHNEHILDDGVRRFDADEGIANAWDRLTHGDFTVNDIELLGHELFESRMEGIFGVNYRTAHDLTEAAGYVWEPIL